MRAHIAFTFFQGSEEWSLYVSSFQRLRPSIHVVGICTTAACSPFGTLYGVVILTMTVGRLDYARGFWTLFASYPGTGFYI